jgi:hypothetical protein
MIEIRRVIKISERLLIADVILQCSVSSLKACLGHTGPAALQKR